MGRFVLDCFAAPSLLAVGIALVEALGCAAPGDGW